MLKCPQHAPHACTKTYIIPRAKQGSSSFLPLQACLLKFKVTISKNKKWNQEKTSEAKKLTNLDFSFYLIKITIFGHIHPKLRNINLHNITHSLISQNPREWVLVVRISLLIVTFLSLITQSLSLMQTIKEIKLWSAFFFLCHLLNVGACICHIAWEGQVEWTTRTEVRG